MFDLHALEKGSTSDKMNVLTFQAMTEDDFEAWVSITGGQIHVTKPQLSSKIELQSKRRETSLFLFIFNIFTDELDESGVDFVKKCIQVIESRDLEEQGLYRVVGMQSKVNSVVAGHFGRRINSFDRQICQNF